MSETPARLRDRLGTVAFAYLARAVVAGLVALGPSVALTRTTAEVPLHDAALFAPGGVLLVESARLSFRPGDALFYGSAAALVLGVVAVALVERAILLAALARPGAATAAEIGAAALRAMPTLAAIVGASLVAEGLLAAVVVSVGALVVDALQLGDRAFDLAYAAVFALAIALASVLGVARDVAAAAVVGEQDGFVAALRRALATILRGPLGLAWAFVWRAALAGLAVALALVADRVAPSLAHQLAAFAVVLAHASWLRACLLRIEAPSA